MSFHRIHDPQLARRIVAHTGLAPPSLIVEAGPGDGMLTAELAAAGLRVIAVEQDRRHFGALQRRFACEPAVVPVLGDIRHVPMPRQPYALVSNVPFGITASFMRWLLSSSRPPVAAWLILERDAAMHWSGAGRSSQSAVLAAVDWRAGVTMALRRRDFVPRPSVDAAVLSLHRREVPLIPPRARPAFESFVRRGYGHGRATALRNLNGAIGYAAFQRVARERNIVLTALPSDLAVEDWLALFRAARR